MFRITCPFCRTEMALPDSLEGDTVVCGNCRATIALSRGKISEQPAQISQGASKPNQWPSRDASAFEESDELLQFEPLENPEEVMDMTPMVDVVFQLLIFFMMTAAFSLQKSLEVPPASRENRTAQAATVEELENESDFVIVRIDRDDNITVDGQDAPSEHELLAKLREAKSGSLTGLGTSRTGLLVLADPECHHETVVMVLDAGNAVGMERVSLTTVEDSVF